MNETTMLARCLCGLHVYSMHGAASTILGFRALFLRSGRGQGAFALRSNFQLQRPNEYWYRSTMAIDRPQERNSTATASKKGGMKSLDTIHERGAVDSTTTP